MSIKYMAWAWTLDLKSTTKYVLVALSDHADDDGNCFPSLRHLAGKTSLGRTALIESLKSLQEMGVLEKTERYAMDGSRRQNLYKINMIDGVRQTDGGGTPNGRGGYAKRTGGVRVADIIYNDESSIESSLKQTRANSDARQCFRVSGEEIKPTPRKKPKIDPRHEEFYALYPNKKAKDRSQKAFLARNFTDAEFTHLMHALKTQIEAYNLNAKSGAWQPVWKHPETWINGGCWDDLVVSVHDLSQVFSDSEKKRLDCIKKESEFKNQQLARNLEIEAQAKRHDEWRIKYPDVFLDEPTGGGMKSIVFRANAIQECTRRDSETKEVCDASK